MRVAMVAQWLRAARQNPERKRACRAYVVAISIAQVGWIAEIFLPLSATQFVLATIGLALVEFAGPYLAEKMDGGTPWHAHHIAERNSLFVIIALGESVVGTVATLSAVVQNQGWTLDAALVAFAGVGLTFGIWWIYYVLPSGPVLHAHRERSFVWGYGHMLIVVSIVATGAGLHVAADYIEGKAQIGALATLLGVAIPIASFIALLYGLYFYLVRQYDRIHTLFLALTALTIAISIVAAMSGLDMAICLAILTFAPAVSVVGYEWVGYRHQADALRREGHRPAE
jgi:low temperature requirement protein LtrA